MKLHTVINIQTSNYLDRNLLELVKQDSIFVVFEQEEYLNIEKQSKIVHYLVVQLFDLQTNQNKEWFVYFDFDKNSQKIGILTQKLEFDPTIKSDRKEIGTIAPWCMAVTCDQKYMFIFLSLNSETNALIKFNLEEQTFCYQILDGLNIEDLHSSVPSPRLNLSPDEKHLALSGQFGVFLLDSNNLEIVNQHEFLNIEKERLIISFHEFVSDVSFLYCIDNMSQQTPVLWQIDVDKKDFSSILYPQNHIYYTHSSSPNTLTCLERNSLDEMGMGSRKPSPLFFRKYQLNKPVLGNTDLLSERNSGLEGWIEGTFFQSQQNIILFESVTNLDCFNPHQFERNRNMVIAKIDTKNQIMVELDQEFFQSAQDNWIRSFNLSEKYLVCKKETITLDSDINQFSFTLDIYDYQFD